MEFKKYTDVEDDLKKICIPGKIYNINACIKYDKDGNLCIHIEDNFNLKIDSPKERVRRSNEYYNAKFDIGFDHAKAYYEEYGDLKVPASFICKDGYTLGQWICNQKNKYSKNRLDESKIKLLESIGIIWRNSKSKFDIGFEHAKAYYEKYENLHVPYNFKSDDGFNLGIWIKHQRDKYKDGLMELKDFNELNSINMIWDCKNAYDGYRSFEKFYNYAKKYYEINGNLQVPVRFICEDGFKLGIYVQRYRKMKHDDKLSLNVIEKLESIGMTWHAIPISN